MKEINQNPKVSIIIPVYNGANYLRYAINSALAQTYNNIEIIVIDDGSTDDTGSIAKSFGNKIRYIRKENGGVSSALNLAIKQMRGDYFSWLSHDDTYEPNKVEVEINYLKENNLLDKKVIIFSDYYLIDKRGKRIAESKKDHEEITCKPEYSLIKGHINGLSLLIPKKAFEEYGEFDTEMVCAQDYEMWRLMSKTYRFIHIPELLVSTRYHSKQVSNTSPKVLTEGNAFYLRAIEDVSIKRREELEGSNFCFLREIAKFHNKDSIYKAVGEFCEKEEKEILQATKKSTEDIKVSVIVPFYNRSNELRRAIDSVLCQTHRNFEIILVNDGSDADLSKIKEFIKDYRNIKLINNDKRLGPSAARNKGIKAAHGEYIAFLDSDDEFVPHKLETQLNFAIASKSNFLHTSYIREINGNNEVVHSGNDDGHCERKLMYNCPIATPTVMIKREWLIENNLFFDEDVTIGEDTCLWLRLIKKNKYLVGIDEPLTVVHVGDNAAAYSDEKQLIGLKTIIRYLITDDFYSKFDLELSRIMNAYVEYAKKIFKEQEPIIDGGPLKKMVFYIKNEGAKSTARRIINKVKKSIRP